MSWMNCRDLTAASISTVMLFLQSLALALLAGLAVMSITKSRWKLRSQSIHVL